ncbi:hypothetical protein C8Q75DRAFT_539170 [Abortiporus biennis]|nr:hypothetical protein C8Q75DRAFT_539170 [Abortiporus biennis]
MDVDMKVKDDAVVDEKRDRESLRDRDADRDRDRDRERDSRRGDKDRDRERERDRDRDRRDSGRSRRADHWEPEERRNGERRRRSHSRPRSRSRRRSTSPRSRRSRRSRSPTKSRSRSPTRSRSRDRDRGGRANDPFARSLGGPMNAPHEEAVEFAKQSKRENRVYVGNLSYDVKYRDLMEFMRGGGWGNIFRLKHFFIRPMVLERRVLCAESNLRALFFGVEVDAVCDSCCVQRHGKRRRMSPCYGLCSMRPG